MLKLKNVHPLGAPLLLMAVCLSASAIAQDDDSLDALFSDEATGSAKAPEHKQPQATPEPAKMIPVTESESYEAIELAPEEAPAVQEPQREKPKYLDEIIVTAQKKAESIQDTPISMQAFDAEALEVKGIEGLGDLGAKVPGMTIEPFPINNATLRIFIRGMGIFDVQVTQDAPIGVYTDGVYVARSTGTAVDMADLERIEVLRGPQGSLYGRNTTGGAVNLITRRPSTDGFEFKQKFTTGNRNFFSSKTTVNVPFADDFAAKFAFMDTRKDGYIDNTGPGDDFGDKRVIGYRGDLRWQPSETLTVDYTYDKSNYDYHNYMYQAVLRPETSKGTTDPIKNSAQAATIYSDRRLDSLSSTAPYELSTTNISGHALTLDFVQDNYNLKYIGAYRTLRDASYAELGGGLGNTDFRIDTNVYDGITADQINGGPTPLVVPVITQNQWTHEIQFAQDGLFDGRFDYIVGAYYFKEEAVEDNTPLHHQFSGFVDDNIIPVVGDLLAPGVGLLFDVGTVRMVNLVSQRYDIENEAQAVFGQGTWTPRIWDQRFHLTLGLRASRDSRRALKNQTDLFYIEGSQQGNGMAFDLGSPVFNNPISDAALRQAGFIIPQNRQFDNVLGESEYDDFSLNVVLEYDLSDDINTYLKRVEGYRSGGFNTRDPQIDGNQGPASDGVDYGFGFKEGFRPEYVTAYELGIKSELMDRRLRLNFDIFHTTHNDLQAPLLINGTVADTKTDNLAEAQMLGAETEIVFALTGDIFFMLNHSYLKTNVDVTADPTIAANYSDAIDFPSAPPHSATFAVDWTLGQFELGSLNLNLDYSYVGKRKGITIKGREGLTELEPFSLVNARVSLMDIPVAGQGTANIAIWARNILDEEYAIHAVDNLPQADRAVLWGESRSFGMDLIYEF